MPGGTTFAQKDAGYQEFFMENCGRKKLMGQSASVDSILLGRDIDFSGENPMKAHAVQYSDHAGLKADEVPQRSFKKPGYSMSCVVDSVLYGRDIDNSGEDVRKEYHRIYSKHAGVKVGAKEPRALRKGNYAMKSKMDDIIYGHDIDQSGADPHEEFCKTYSGHAGVRSQEHQRPFRKHLFAQNAVMDDVLYGRDIDMSGSNPHKAHMDTYGDYAGMKSADMHGGDAFLPHRKGINKALSLGAQADQVIQNRDIDGSGVDHQVKHFVDNFQRKGHAGLVSGAPHQFSPKVVPGDPSRHVQKRDPCDCLSTRKAPPQQKFNFTPGLRSCPTATQCTLTTARSRSTGTGTQSQRSQSQRASTSRTHTTKTTTARSSQLSQPATQRTQTSRGSMTERSHSTMPLTARSETLQTARSSASLLTTSRSKSTVGSGRGTATARTKTTTTTTTTDRRSSARSSSSAPVYNHHHHHHRQSSSR
mmetsp:Transcript_79786/g.165810  ORF Transcript_79786/g.165810 Transcript_79786/m.165810 type:complete len:475 (-) Transcript_79786:68-1492(-)